MENDMKKITFIILLLIIHFSCFAENNLRVFLNDKAYDWYNLPREERAFGVDSKITYKIEIKPITDLKDERPYLLSSVIRQHLEKYYEIQKSDILQYLNSNQNFILYDCQPTVEYNSYRKLKINNEIIGETSFCANNDKLEADGIFSYHIYFIDNDKIYQFWLEYRCSEAEKHRLNELKDIFVYENNKLYWKNEKSRYDFFLLLKKEDKMLPENLLTYQQIYSDICTKLKVNGITVKMY